MYSLFRLLSIVQQSHLIHIFSILQSVPVLSALKTASAAPGKFTTAGVITGSVVLLTTSNSITIGAYLIGNNFDKVNQKMV